MARASGWEYREKLHYSKGNVRHTGFTGPPRAALAGDPGRGGGSVCRESLPNGNSVNAHQHSGLRLWDPRRTLRPALAAVAMRGASSVVRLNFVQDLNPDLRLN